MRAPRRLLHTSIAAVRATPMALVLAACAVSDAPPHVSIYPQTHYEGIDDAALSADVDFKRHVIRVDIQGERYAGDMAWTPNENGFKSQLRSSSGAAMNCFIGEWLQNVWRGKCTDSRQRVFMLEVGHPAHV